MAVKQIAFDIPQAIQDGIDEGIFIRFGGVVRDQMGHIVTHLKEVPISETDSKLNKNSFGEFGKKSKYFIIGTILVAAVAAGVTYVAVKNKKNREVRIPKCLADFNEAFAEYISSIKNGTNSEEKIDKVMIALEEIKKSQENRSIDITFSVENISLLLDVVRDYTIKFAKTNSFEIVEEDLGKRDEIMDLQHYLKIQKQVFKMCS